ncbi:MAG: TorF family putative porin [Gammaproteobacteria bacterium]|nr:TorF family putative porin [Gammaproteobacteria bacterium]MBU1555991.1 TorF family putative porin [Gammaproteobacteria bacterium]MBU2070376.1 TorF family putative porin [Gammaproteobacteria bacterium]MBU2184762.1 TorF family putative porin [Gammaproteobacteria bacterium]MBU2203677.1 TorF family putative porin [Gammaproteobacteria bacterium]
MQNLGRTTLATTVVLLGLALASDKAAAAELSGDITFTSDYAFRGISQTEEAPALQGGLTLSAESGFYVSVWGSNVDFLAEGTLELDVMLGWSGAINDDWSTDVGIMRYGYPNAEIDGSNFWEIYGSLSYKDLTFGLAYSDDYYANSGNFIYLYASYSYALTDSISLDMQLGQNEYDDSSASYMDWSVGLSTEVMGAGVSLAYVDTDIDGSYLADSRVILSVSKSF